MPELPICDDNGCLLPDAALRVMAHMYYPEEDTAMRLALINAFRALNLAADERFIGVVEQGRYSVSGKGGKRLVKLEATRRRRRLPFLRDLYDQVGGLAATVELPLGARGMIEAANRDAIRGQIAGEVLLGLLAQRQAGKPLPSIRQAIQALAAHVEQKKLKPASDASLEDAWYGYHSVAHLWAAFRRSGERDTAAVVHPPRRLIEFLAQAEAYRAAANNLPRRHGDQPPIPDDVAWVPPAHLELPLVEIELPRPPANYAELLKERKYKRPGQKR
jgi:hypothetical protein